jgi:hypothetical protein
MSLSRRLPNNQSAMFASYTNLDEQVSLSGTRPSLSASAKRTPPFVWLHSGLKTALKSSRHVLQEHGQSPELPAQPTPYLDGIAMLDACAVALTKMKEALEALDSADAPAEIGAHLDLAVCRLEDFLGSRTGQSRTAVEEMLAK